MIKKLMDWRWADAAGAVLTGIIIMMTLVLYWTVWPHTVLTTFQIQTAPVAVSGRGFVYELTYCKDVKYAELPSAVMLELTDHVVLQLPPTVVVLAPGCHTRAEFLELPKVPSGVYKLHVRHIYAPNPVRRLTAEAWSNAFMITDK